MEEIIRRKWQLNLPGPFHYMTVLSSKNETKFRTSKKIDIIGSSSGCSVVWNIQPDIAVKLTIPPDVS